MNFKNGNINDVIIKQLKKNIDERGWLVEIFRKDEINPEILPVMGYISLTLPGIIRGPHEHKYQTDIFGFIGPSNFKILLWDNRKESETYGNKMEIYGGEDNPILVVIPPGVVHGYKNAGIVPGLVYNLPNKLYKGEGKKEAVDEIRHEDDPDSPFKFL